MSRKNKRNKAKQALEQYREVVVRHDFFHRPLLQSEVVVTSNIFTSAPMWVAKYENKGHKIVLVVDANSGRVINSLEL